MTNVGADCTLEMNTCELLSDFVSADAFLLDMCTRLLKAYDGRPPLCSHSSFVWVDSQFSLMVRSNCKICRVELFTRTKKAHIASEDNTAQRHECRQSS